MGNRYIILTQKYRLYNFDFIVITVLLLSVVETTKPSNFFERWQSVQVLAIFDLKRVV